MPASFTQVALGSSLCVHLSRAKADLCGLPVIGHSDYSFIRPLQLFMGQLGPGVGWGVL